MHCRQLRGSKAQRSVRGLNTGLYTNVCTGIDDTVNVHCYVRTIVGS